MAVFTQSICCERNVHYLWEIGISFNSDYTNISNFYPLKVVDRSSKTQLQVGKNCCLSATFSTMTCFRLIMAEAQWVHIWPFCDLWPWFFPDQQIFSLPWFTHQFFSSSGLRWAYAIVLRLSSVHNSQEMLLLPQFLSDFNFVWFVWKSSSLYIEFSYRFLKF